MSQNIANQLTSSLLAHLILLDLYFMKSYLPGNMQNLFVYTMCEFQLTVAKR